MGTGATPISVCDVTDFGSVISRVSGESSPEAAKAIHSANIGGLNLIDNPQNCDAWSFAARRRAGAFRMCFQAQVPLNLRMLRNGIQTRVRESWFWS